MRDRDNARAVERNLKEWGLSGGEQYREATHAGFWGALHSYPQLSKIVGKEDSKHEHTLAYRLATEPREQLKMLMTMPISQALECLTFGEHGQRAVDYVTKRLPAYEKLVSTFEGYGVDEFIQGIRHGLRRDIAFAFMIGSPELGAYTIAKKRLSDANVASVRALPPLKGAGTGIHDGYDSIGTYAALFDVYANALHVVAQKRGAPEDANAAEHKAVLLMSQWLVKAMEYSPVGRGDGSPYVAPLEEAVAWARLGESVQRQLRGMRHRIGDVNLRNIGRFIGRSGDSRYQREAQTLKRHISLVENPALSEHSRSEITERYNKRDLAAHLKRCALEEQKVTRRFERSEKLRQSLELPADENELQSKAAITSRDRALGEVERLKSERTVYLSTRDSDQLLTDLKEKLVSLSTKAERHKSLAQKALDLHFHFNHAPGDARGSMPFADVVDWINEASFGQINRAHHMLTRGVSDATIILLSADDWRAPIEKLLDVSRWSTGDIHTAGLLLEAAHAAGLSPSPRQEPGIKDCIEKVLRDALVRSGMTEDGFSFELDGIKLTSEARENVCRAVIRELSSAPSLYRSEPNAVALTSCLIMIGEPIHTRADVQAAVRQAILTSYDVENYVGAANLRSLFFLPRSEFKAVALEALNKEQYKGNRYAVRTLSGELQADPAELLSLPSVASRLESCIRSGNVEALKGSIRALRVPLAELTKVRFSSESIASGLYSALSDGSYAGPNVSRYEQLRRLVKAPREACVEAARMAVSTKLRGTCSVELVTSARAIQSLVGLDEAELCTIVGSEVARRLVEEGAHSEALQLMDLFGIPQTELQILPQPLVRLSSNFELTSLRDIMEFQSRNPKYLRYVWDVMCKGDMAPQPLLTKELSTIATKLHITFTEGEILLQHGVDLKRCLAVGDYAAVYDCLRNHAPEWSDVPNIQSPFEKGAAIFGHKAMLAYGCRDGLSRHDAYFAFKDVLRLYQRSNLTPEQFNHAILLQVVRDGSTYREGTAHHHLNTIAKNITENLQDILGKAQDYDFVKRMQELVKTYQSPERIFASWRDLKRFSELHSLLGRVQVLKQLKTLKESGSNDRLCDYVETLAFSESGVNMESAIMFATNPAAFLALGDHHSGEAHQSKKPSNYTTIPHLGLTAEGLRDALVNGVLDRVQVFSPLEIRYLLPKDGNIQRMKDTSRYDLREALRLALGSRRENSAGKARDVKKLYHQCKQLLRGAENVASYLAGGAISAEMERALETLVHDDSIGMSRAEIVSDPGMVSIVAKINLKSDPDGVLAGNDTACCMPFGSGKNNVYTYNPNCVLFTVQVVAGNGRARTIAQSVLTKDKDIEIPISVVRNAFASEGALEKVIPEKILKDAPAYLACDNVEVAPNYQDKRWSQILKIVYNDFFSEYMRRHAKAQGIHPHVVPIGTSHSDALRHLTRLPNTFIPLAPVAYSDKYGDEVYALNLTADGSLPHREIVECDVPPIGERTETPIAVKGVEYLDFTDTLMVTYLERGGYRSNPSLIADLHNMENGLIAKDINNVLTDRPNLSLKCVTPQGKVDGYLFAYEGRFAPEHGTAPLERGERVVFVSDLVAAQGSRFAGGKLIHAFLELYERHYLEHQEFVPIYAELRDKTSYPLLKRKLHSLGERFGWSVEMTESAPERVGTDTMYPVLIKIHQKVANRDKATTPLGA